MINRLSILLILSTGILFSCTGTPSHKSEEKTWLPSGQIVISRAVPEAAAPRSLNMLGFLPVLGTQTGVWLSINQKDKNLSLMDGSRVLSTTPLEGGKALQPGSYQVMHLQRNALWYAPDSYFTNRSLPIPAEGDKERFRRGALGEFSVFLNKDTPIHSGPVWSEEVGGIRLDEASLSKIYYQVQIGSIIEVK